MKNIALSFSGGGFRAAAYSLGCLAYLNRLQFEGKPLLESVKFISSTSGGSITNLVYSAHIFDGKSFDDVYRLLNEKLEGDTLMAEALRILNTQSEWKDRPEKSRNLINAFSMVYDDLLQRKSLGMFSNNTNKPHLEEICVNATDFTNGLPFRFQSQPENPKMPRGKIGNSYIYFLPGCIDKAHQIKLADILASSSCFPSGFEPMIFPKDYTNRAVNAKTLMESLSYKANEFTIEEYNHISFLKNDSFDKNCEFGIMDGGITDNQAIDAFMKADDRRKDYKGEIDLKPFDLFISCDVASMFMDGYTLPVQKSKVYDFLSIRALLVLAVLAMLWLPYLVFFKAGAWKPWEYVTATLSGIFLLIPLFWIIGKIRKLFKKSEPKSTWSVVFGKFKWRFASLSLGFVKQMIASRAKSVFILSNDIYLKQIRRMYYDKLFSVSAYKDRSIQNAIYTLSKVTLEKHEYDPTPEIINVAEKARTMGTTLWFDENHQKSGVKRAIIATGQFTTCYNLLVYLNNKSEKNVLPPELQPLLEAVRKDWELFKQNPFEGIAS